MANCPRNLSVNTSSTNDLHIKKFASKVRMMNGWLSQDPSRIELSETVES